MMSTLLTFTSKTSEATTYLGSNTVFDDRYDYSCCFLDFFTHTSALNTVLSVHTIKIKCNLTSGSFSNNNNKYAHVIHEFTPISQHLKIVEKAKHLIYLPVNSRGVSNVSISVVDQNDEPINFDGGKFTCRLHIKRNDHISELSNSL